ALAAAAQRLGCDLPTIEAVATVESSGTYFWTIGGADRPPVRLEAHIFSRLTNHQFDQTNPQISSKTWNPALAAKTRVDAYAQLEQAKGLNKSAALQACSWGAFQIMGQNWKGLRYGSVDDMVSAMNSVTGQIDAFIRFMENKAGAIPALKN